MPTARSANLNATPIVLTVGSLRVEFTWRADRYVHSIIADTQRLASIEGDAEQAWPSSPPAQQLSLEQIAGAHVVLGVGLAGKSHWSVSVEKGEHGVKFDWACQCKSSPHWLGSTYALGNDAFRITAGEGSALARHNDRLTVQPVAADIAGTHRWAYCVDRIRKT